jgi:hypothetical protein
MPKNCYGKNRLQRFYGFVALSKYLNFPKSESLIASSNSKYQTRKHRGGGFPFHAIRTSRAQGYRLGGLSPSMPKALPLELPVEVLVPMKEISFHAKGVAFGTAFS